MREWGDGLLVLGLILAVIAAAFAVAQGLLASAGPRTYGFRDAASGAILLAMLLCILGGVLRGLDHFTASGSRAHGPRLDRAR